jgi:hypothetical protein|eukprot:31468-Pelagococcus_subviridis.AAC.11
MAALVAVPPLARARFGRSPDAEVPSSSSARASPPPSVGARSRRRRSGARLRALPLDATTLTTLTTTTATTTSASASALFDVALFGLGNPFADAAKDANGGDLPGWFPAASFFAYVFITREVGKIRREQERKAMEKARAAAAESAQKAVEGITPEAWAKLVICLLIDGVGDSSFLLPGVGEFSDAAYAPLEAFLLGQLFRSNAISSLGFVEEALPFTDVLPTATLAWVIEEFFGDTWVARRLGINGIPPKPAKDAAADANDGGGEEKEKKKGWFK